MNKYPACKVLFRKPLIWNFEIVEKVKNFFYKTSSPNISGQHNILIPTLVEGYYVTDIPVIMDICLIVILLLFLLLSLLIRRILRHWYPWNHGYLVNLIFIIIIIFINIVWLLLINRIRHFENKSSSKHHWWNFCVTKKSCWK